MESAAKVREREIERLSRGLEAARGETSGAEVAAGRDSTKLGEEAKRLEAALQQAKVGLPAPVCVCVCVCVCAHVIDNVFWYLCVL